MSKGQTAREKAEARPPPMDSSNPMRRVRIDKVVVNIGVGQAGEQLIKGEKVLEMVTGRKPARTRSKTQNKELGIRVGMPIGAKVTLRGQAAAEFIKTAFYLRNNKINWFSFDPEGNFSFGVQDYTSFPNQKYSPEIGIFGMDISVTLRRAGARVARRHHARSHIPVSHRLTPKEAQEWLAQQFGVEVV